MYLIETDYTPDQSSFRNRPQKPLLPIRQFLSSGDSVAEIRFSHFEYKDAASCRSTFAKTIKYYNLQQQVSVRMAGKKVYLIRKEARP